MSREHIARAALRAFPASLRATQGEEMLGTLLDVSATSRRRFALELVGLAAWGTRMRATQRAQAGAPRVIADGVCLAGIWLMTLFLASDLGDRIRGTVPGYPSDRYSPGSLALLSVALALALIGYDRLAGSAALLFVASLSVDPRWLELNGSRRQMMLVPLICFITLLLAPRRRKPDLRRLAWLALTVVLTIASTRGDDTTAAILVLAVIFLVPTALAMFRTNPGPAIACALAATSFGIHMAQDPGGPGILGIVFLSAAPLVIAASATRTRHLRTQAPI